MWGSVYTRGWEPMARESDVALLMNAPGSQINLS